MNCVDLHRSLSAGEDLDIARQTHLKSCAACTALCAELDLIARSAEKLQASDEPSPRVWNSIETALRQEGLIREQASPRLVQGNLIQSRKGGSGSNRGRGFSSFTAGWGWRGWLVPAAAALLVVVGIVVNQRSLVYQLSQHIAKTENAKPAVEAVAGVDITDPNLAGLNDDDFLQEIENQSPEVRAQDVDNLRRANDYIRDAQSVVNNNPNDEESRRSLLEAYQQKAMLFEMAMDRSLP